MAVQGERPLPLSAAAVWCVYWLLWCVRVLAVGPLRGAGMAVQGERPLPLSAAAVWCGVCTGCYGACACLQSGRYEVPAWLSKESVHFLSQVLRVCTGCYGACACLQSGRYEVPAWLSKESVHFLSQLLRVCTGCYGARACLQSGRYEVPAWLSKESVHFLSQLLQCVYWLLWCARVLAVGPLRGASVAVQGERPLPLSAAACVYWLLWCVRVLAVGPLRGAGVAVQGERPLPLSAAAGVVCVLAVMVRARACSRAATRCRRGCPRRASTSSLSCCR